MAAAEERLARYKVSGSVGRGSYGEVFLVTHRGDGKKVRSRAVYLHPQAVCSLPASSMS